MQQSHRNICLEEVSLGGVRTELSIQQPYAKLYLALVGRQNRDIEMADEVWRFFQDKSNPQN